MILYLYGYREKYKALEIPTITNNNNNIQCGGLGYVSIWPFHFVDKPTLETR